MKRGTPNHPKTVMLAVALGIERWGAVGVLESLWHFASQYARRGDIGRHRDVAIAQGIGWTGDPGTLVEALVDSGWVDACECHRLRVHDWPEHVDQSVGRSKEVLLSGYVACYSVKESKTYTSSSNLVPDETEKADGKAKAKASVVEGVQGEPATGTPARVTEGSALIVEVSKLANLDPSEVLKEASKWKGHGYVRLDTMTPDRLEHTIIALRRWLRVLKGEPEVALPASRAAPSSKAAARAQNFQAAMLGGLKGDGTVSMEATHDGRGVVERLGRVDRSLPAAGRSERADGAPGEPVPEAP